MGVPSVIHHYLAIAGACSIQLVVKILATGLGPAMGPPNMLGPVHIPYDKMSQKIDKT